MSFFDLEETGEPSQSRFARQLPQRGSQVDWKTPGPLASPYGRGGTAEGGDGEGLLTKFLLCGDGWADKRGEKGLQD